MRLTVHRQTRSRTNHRDRHDRPRTKVLQTLARAKRSGGPEDRALYTCGCGFAWTAAVTTAVGCPHCGVTQAW
jgi:hypothetical protein